MTTTIANELKAIRRLIPINLKEADARIDALYERYTECPVAFTEDEENVMFLLIEKISYERYSIKVT